MGNYTIFLMFENHRRGRQARNFTTNDPKILDLKSSSEQIFFRKSSLGASATAISAILILLFWPQILDRLLTFLTPKTEGYFIRVEIASII